MYDFLNIITNIFSDAPQETAEMKPEKLSDLQDKCYECGGIYMCVHKRVGELFESEKIDTTTGNVERIRVDTSVAATPKRTLISPPPDVVVSKDIALAANAPETTITSKGGVLSTEKPKTASTYKEGYERTFGKKTASAKDWLICNVCNKNINLHYFDEHIKMHTAEFANPSLVNHSPSITGITGIPVNKTTAIVASSYIKPDTTPKAPTFPKVNAPEIHRFRKIERAISHASTSVSKRYSDYTLVFVLENKPSAFSSSYSSGTSTNLYRDFERLIIHIVYDSIDDYFLVSSKISKRSSHSSWDTDDAPIPERVCYQEELLTEIRRAILYMGCDPKSAYKHYRRMLRDEIVSESDDRSRVLVSKTTGFEEFMDSMKKNGGSHGYNQNHSDQHYCG